MKYVKGFEPRNIIREKAIDIYLKRRELAKTDCDKYKLYVREKDLDEYQKR